MFGREKEKEGVASTLLPGETLRKIGLWRHPAAMPGGSPVTILTQTLATLGRAAYLEACQELLTAMRRRFGTRPGFNILVTTYCDPRNGRMLSIEPSPRPGSDCIRDGEGEGGLNAVHPIKFEEVVIENRTQIL